jgi:hypothetical protein
MKQSELIDASAYSDSKGSHPKASPSLPLDQATTSPVCQHFVQLSPPLGTLHFVQLSRPLGTLHKQPRILHLYAISGTALDHVMLQAIHVITIEHTQIAYVYIHSIYWMSINTTIIKN